MSHLLVEQEDAVTILRFLLGLTRMKVIPRSGWISHGVSLQDVESVADHSFSTCALSLLLADLEANRGARISIERVLRLAVLHDMAESLTFDISKGYLEYLGKRGEAIKDELERTAWKHLARSVQDPRLTRQYTRLHTEYVVNRTTESKIVHAADGLDILLQVIDYRRRGYPESMLADLWNATSAQLRGSQVPSARKLHDLIRNQARKMSDRRRTK